MNHGIDRLWMANLRELNFFMFDYLRIATNVGEKNCYTFPFNYNFRLWLETYNLFILHITECGCGYLSHLVQVLKVKKPQKEEKQFCQHQGIINNIPD